jgi:16S rRNA (guanine527-N7)-methyltransferase
VKHFDLDGLVDEVARLAGLEGISLSAQQCEDLAYHLAHVLRANEEFNLTAIRDPKDAVRLQVLDSLTALWELEQAPPGPAVDIGSGAGFPGVPLGIVSERPVLLVESVGKKARFLEEIAGSLSPRYKIAVSNARAEEVALQERGAFAVVTARALSTLASLVELAAPLLQTGGSLVALKGPVSNSEIARGDAAGAVVGLDRVCVRSLSLPEVGESRTLVTYEKVRGSRIGLPRRNGSAQRRPLA